MLHNLAEQNEAIHNKDFSVVKTFKAVLANRFLFYINQVFFSIIKTYYQKIPFIFGA